MLKISKNIIVGAAVGSALSGLAVSSALADQTVAQAPASPSAAAPPAAPAAPPAPAAATSPLIAPAITGPLAIQLPPPKYTLPLLGTVYLDGIGSGLGQWQNNPFPGNRAWQPDLSNGQLFLQKTDGIFQFYTQFGAYSIAALGAPYTSAATATFGDHAPTLGGVQVNGNLWGWFPVGFAKIAPTDNFSILGGKLPTLVGAEYTFSFENINIERGLLWNQEPAVSKGGQVNYTIGPAALSLSFTDGFDSGVYNWLTGAVTWTINSANSFEFVGGGNVGRTNVSTLRTPLPQSNSQIFDLIYTYNKDPWVIQPYFQATHVPSNPSLGWTSSSSTFGFAVLANYNLGHGFNLGGRVEYIASTGNPATAPDLLYGPGSGAFSLTLTPTYQWNSFFARTEFSWVKANSIVAGVGLGPNFDGNSQTRIMLETGIMF